MTGVHNLRGCRESPEESARHSNTRAQIVAFIQGAKDGELAT
ncbi:MAG: hypothetical protein ACRDTT_24605 [Pseudonocardiaceae bacterium]